MRVLIQRVRSCRLDIDDVPFSEIQQGLLILLGICDTDQEDDITYLVKKIIQLRIFSDSEGKMNLSCEDIKGEYLVVSQFTLYAATQKGNRPSYIRAARPETAIPLYEAFLTQLQAATSGPIRTGKFGANMQIHLCNDGPVSIWMDSKERDY